MRIVYVSTDEVNQALAEQVAAECRAVISARPPEALPKDGLFDAVLYNLDDMPREERSALLEEFRRDKPDHPTAVHGYEISDEQARTLKRNGVVAARRLSPVLLRGLLSAARRNREAVPPDDAMMDLTWVDLVK
jgi:hypothetical protein